MLARGFFSSAGTLSFPGVFALRGRAMNTPSRGHVNLFELSSLILFFLLSLCFQFIAGREKSKSGNYYRLQTQYAGGPSEARSKSHHADHIASTNTSTAASLIQSNGDRGGRGIA